MIYTAGPEKARPKAKKCLSFQQRRDAGFRFYSVSLIFLTCSCDKVLAVLEAPFGACSFLVFLVFCRRKLELKGPWGIIPACPSLHPEPKPRQAITWRSHKSNCTKASDTSGTRRQGKHLHTLFPTHPTTASERSWKVAGFATNFCKRN